MLSSPTLVRCYPHVVRALRDRASSSRAAGRVTRLGKTRPRECGRSGQSMARLVRSLGSPVPFCHNTSDWFVLASGGGDNGDGVCLQNVSGTTAREGAAGAETVGRSRDVRCVGALHGIRLDGVLRRRLAGQSWAIRCSARWPDGFLGATSTRDSGPWLLGVVYQFHRRLANSPQFDTRQRPNTS